MSTTMPMRTPTLATEEGPRRTRLLRLHPSQRSLNRVPARGRSTRITTNQNIQSMRQTWRMNMSTTRLTRLIQPHRYTMDLSPKIPFPRKEVQEAAGKGSPAQEVICRPASTSVPASLELKSLALVYSPVEGGVPDPCHLLNMCTYQHLRLAINVKCW